MENFWIVWGNEGRTPTFKHTTEESARTEAERLARVAPGQVFHVMALVDSCKKNDVLWASEMNIKNDDGIPF